MSTAIKTIERRPRVEADQPPLLLLLHGYGANERDLFDMAEAADPRLAYKFDFDHAMYRDPEHMAVVRELAARVRKWRDTWKPNTAFYTDEGDRFVIVDSRGGTGLRRVRDDPPEAAVIGLDRLPSHGREVAAWLRQSKATRSVPLLFAGGAADKVARVRALLPDATYTDWARLGPALRSALRAPLADPVVPAPMAGYSGTPLPKKLGIKEGTLFSTVHAPDGFDATLGELPPEAEWRRRLTAGLDVVVAFYTSRATLAAQWPKLTRAAAPNGSPVQ